MTMQPATQSIQPLGTNGDRRRFLLHHVPIAFATAALLVVFMTLPAFDASTYRYGDIVSDTFPHARDDDPSRRQRMHQSGHHDGGAQTPRTAQDGDHAVATGHNGRTH